MYQAAKDTNIILKRLVQQLVNKSTPIEPMLKKFRFTQEFLCALCTRQFHSSMCYKLLAHVTGWSIELVG